jgi:hypothetical protein
MNGYNFNGVPHNCLKLLAEVKRQKILLDVSMCVCVCVSLFGACSNVGIVSMCQDIVEYISIELLQSLRLKKSLIDLCVNVLNSGDFDPTPYEFTGRPKQSKCYRKVK